MMLFPSCFEGPFGISRLLYYTAVWSGGRTSEVQMRGFDTMRTHVGEIARSASRDRVERLSRFVNLLSGSPRATLLLPPDIAAGFFEACLFESPALLELGYPRDEPAVFATSFPSPARNSVRTVNQIRSAVHHLGGDFELLRSLLRSGEHCEPSLSVEFSLWPSQRTADGTFALRLGYSGQTVPSLMILRRRLAGYVLLCCWDMALRLRDTERIPLSDTDFRTFALNSLEMLERGSNR